MKRKRLSAPKKTGHGFRKSPYGEPDYKKRRYRIYTSPRIGWPQEYVTTLQYVTIGTLNTVAGTIASLRLTSNAFDVDPSLGGTAMPGFTEYANFYTRFRVLQFSYETQFLNREAFNILGYSGFSNSSAAVVGHTTTGQALWKSGTMGPLTGCNKLKLRDSQSIVTITGTKTSLFDDLFTGSTSSSSLPSAGTCHYYAVIESPNAVFTAGGGADYRVIISLKLQFYKVNTLVT